MHKIKAKNTIRVHFFAQSDVAYLSAPPRKPGPIQNQRYVRN